MRQQIFLLAKIIAVLMRLTLYMIVYLDGVNNQHEVGLCFLHIAADTAALLLTKRGKRGGFGKLFVNVKGQARIKQPAI